MEITEFLQARIAEGEARARRAAAEAADQWHLVATAAAARGVHGGWHVLDHAPARVLAECQGKREVIGLLQDSENFPAGDMGWHYMKRVVATLALPYAEHPDFLPEWRP